MKSIVTAEGTAMSEATLCNECFKSTEATHAARTAAENAEDFAGLNWQDSSENEAVACIWCGTEEG